MQSKGERGDKMLTKPRNPAMMFHADLMGATGSSE
jgi:hypothetical protein